MTGWLIVLGVVVLASAYAIGAALRRRRPGANRAGSRRRRFERIGYAVLAVVCIVVGLNLMGAW